MDHEAKDAHHGGTAVVELNGALGKLGLLIEGIPAKVEGAVAEVAGELGLASDVLHDTQLKEANEEEDLDETSLGDSVGAEDGGETVGEGVEGVSSLVDGSVEVDAGTGDDLAEEGLQKEGKFIMARWNVA